MFRGGTDEPTKHRRNNATTTTTIARTSNGSIPSAPLGIPAQRQQPTTQRSSTPWPSGKRRQHVVRRPRLFSNCRPDQTNSLRTVRNSWRLSMSSLIGCLAFIALTLSFIGTTLLPILYHWYWGCPKSDLSGNDIGSYLRIPPTHIQTNETSTSTRSITTTRTDRTTDLCFVTCIFGDSIDIVDHPGNVEYFSNYWCNARFLLVTNLHNLPAPGWEKVILKTSTVPSSGGSSSSSSVLSKSEETSNSNNMIIQSREAKFLGWKVLPVQDCRAVVYMDGYLVPKTSTIFDFDFNFGLYVPTKLQRIVDQVKSHPFGLSQVKQKYFNGLSIPTLLNNLVRDKKDTVEHVNATLQWMVSQDDYQPVMTYYLNKYFGTS